MIHKLADDRIKRSSNHIFPCSPILSARVHVTGASQVAELHVSAKRCVSEDIDGTCDTQKGARYDSLPLTCPAPKTVCGVVTPVVLEAFYLPRRCLHFLNLTLDPYIPYFTFHGRRVKYGKEQLETDVSKSGRGAAMGSHACDKGRLLDKI